MKFILLLLIGLLSLSCRNNTSLYSDLPVLPSDSIKLELSEPRQMAVFHGNLFVVDRKAIDNFVQVYSLDTKSFMFSFASFGQGPEEFISLNSIDFYKEDGTDFVDLYDFTNKVLTYKLEDIMYLKSNVRPIKIKSVSEIGLSVLGFNRVNKGYISTGMYNKGKYALFSDSLHVVKFSGEYRRKPNPSYPDEIHYMANYGRQYFSDDRRFMVETVTPASFLTLYEIRNNDVVKIWEYVIEDLDYDVESGSIPVYKSKRGYASVSITKNRVYAIYSGEPAYTPDFCGREIHVFDIHTGELLKKLFLDRRSSHIVVDEDKGKMYIETNFPEPIVLIYDLPE